MKRKHFVFIGIVFLTLLLIGCTLPVPDGSSPGPVQPGASETPLSSTPVSGQVITGQARVEEISINVLESFPVQVRVVARGNFSEGCTTIEKITTQREGDTFNVGITTARPSDTDCTEALVPFEETIALDVVGLPAGTYSVNVNGVTGSFTLETQNEITTPTPQPTSDITGVVWHDLCAVAGGEGEEPAEPSEGCVAGDQGGFQANGVRGLQEPGLEGVLVDLGEGVCPADGLDTAVTDTNGAFEFENLPAGIYCVSIDAQKDANADALLPGMWTHPEVDNSAVTVTLREGEARLEVSFGWDFQFLPEPDELTADCINRAEFVDDVTVEDDAEFAPGSTFVKTWRLRNDGTCTWTTDYALVFVEGDRMGATSPIPLPNSVEPDQTIDLSVELTAPNERATYRGDWALLNIAGDEFGLGEEADETFWVQIVVTAEAAPVALDLGSPTWQDSFDNASSWFLLNTANTKFQVEDGHLEMEALDPDGFEEWGLSNRPVIKDFYMEVTFRTGEKCSGLDRYGVLVRSPDPNMGYVFGFTCDGRYRLYKWDGETYNPIQEWKNSPHILVGPEKTNKLGFWGKGRTIKLYANGQLLGEWTDNTYKEGRFGLFIGSANTENLKVFVDELAYWLLDD